MNGVRTLRILWFRVCLSSEQSRRPHTNGKLSEPGMAMLWLLLVMPLCYLRHDGVALVSPWTCAEYNATILVPAYLMPAQKSSTQAAFRNHVSCLSASTGRRPWNGGAVRWRQRAGSMPGGGSSKTRLRWTTRRGALLARDVPRTTQDKNAPLRTARPRSTCPDFLAVLLSCTVFAVQLPTMVNCVKQNLAD